MDRANKQMQLMQMQLQFERQRREVHAERNRRLLGKLRDSRALEELNSSMVIFFFHVHPRLVFFFCMLSVLALLYQVSSPKSWLRSLLA